MFSSASSRKPRALPAVRTNHLGIDSCYGHASRSSSATPAAQHRCKLDRACVKLAMTVVTLCTVAMILMMISCCPPADSYEIHVVLGATTEVLTVAPHWTAREVTAALEAKTGRSLRGCWLLAPGAKVLRVGKKTRTLGELGVRKDSVLEVRHRVHGGMGCAGSKAVDTRDVQLDFKMPDFEYSTPMLVMPFLQFKAQGRIMKSVQKWRDEALAQGWLVEFKEGEGKVAIFISHTWWDRDFKDETNDKNDQYDVGSPDYQADLPDVEREVRDDSYNLVKRTFQRPKDLKWRVICAGVERLIEEKGLEAESVMIWCDWQSIYQDHKEEKLKGVKSLIQYATMCEYMLVPTEEEGYLSSLGPHEIPGYGTRGWCRVEYFVFLLLAEMQGKEGQVQLYAIKRDGQLRQYERVLMFEGDMPSGGALSNPDDKALVKGLEDQIIDVYGRAIVEITCSKAKKGEEVLLDRKMLRAQHVESLMAAANKYRVTELVLRGNQLGPEGGAKLAEALKTNTSLKELDVYSNGLDDSAQQALRAAAGSRVELMALGLE